MGEELHPDARNALMVVINAVPMSVCLKAQEFLAGPDTFERRRFFSSFCQANDTPLEAAFEAARALTELHKHEAPDPPGISTLRFSAPNPEGVETHFKIEMVWHIEKESVPFYLAEMEEKAYRMSFLSLLSAYAQSGTQGPPAWQRLMESREDDF